jgi:hypothetical protein
MNNLLRKIAPVGFAAVALAATAIAPATAAVWNTHDCKYYGVCAPWNLQYPSASNSGSGALYAPYSAGSPIFSGSSAYQGEETEGQVTN